MCARGCAARQPELRRRAASPRSVSAWLPGRFKPAAVPEKRRPLFAAAELGDPTAARYLTVWDPQNFEVLRCAGETVVKNGTTDEKNPWCIVAPDDFVSLRRPSSGARGAVAPRAEGRAPPAGAGALACCSCARVPGRGTAFPRVRCAPRDARCAGQVVSRLRTRCRRPSRCGVAASGTATSRADQFPGSMRFAHTHHAQTWRTGPCCAHSHAPRAASSMHARPALHQTCASRCLKTHGVHQT